MLTAGLSVLGDIDADLYTSWGANTVRYEGLTWLSRVQLDAAGLIVDTSAHDLVVKFSLREWRRQRTTRSAIALMGQTLV